MRHLIDYVRLVARQNQSYMGPSRAAVGRSSLPIARELRDHVDGTGRTPQTTVRSRRKGRNPQLRILTKPIPSPRDVCLQATRRVAFSACR
jgi:hypothetical protein